MNKIIYSSKLIRSKNSQYFAFPVIQCKISLQYLEKNELNQFEKVILSLLSIKFYSLEELTNTILLDKQLVELILHKLIDKNYIDESHKITDRGKDALFGISEEKKQEIAYVFYDLNRDCLLKNIVNISDFKTTCNIKIKKQNYFPLETDIKDDFIPYVEINLKNNITLNEADLIKKIKKEIFEFNTNRFLENVNIIHIDYSKYYLISKIYYENIDDKSYCIANPFTLDNDDELFYFIASHTNVSDVKKLVLNLLKEGIEDNRANKKYDEKYLKLIKERLFNKPINELDEWLIDPLYDVIKALNKEESERYQDFLNLSQDIKNAMLKLADLFEDILFNSAMKYDKVYRNVASYPEFGLDLCLEKIAEEIGFNITDKSKSIFKTSKRNMIQCINNPSKKKINECLGINLCLAHKNKNHYFYKLSENNKNFIDMLYKFKRNFRDVNRHDNKIGILSPKKYFDLLFDLIEYSLHYKVNLDVLSQITGYKSKDTSAGYAREYIKSQIKESIVKSENEESVTLIESLIMMYNSFINEDARYLENVYSIIDNCFKRMLVYFKNRYKLKYISLKDSFDNRNDVMRYLDNIKMNIVAFDEIPNVKLINSISFQKDSSKSFNDNFKNSVLSEEICNAIAMMKNNKKVKNEILQFNDLFILVVSITSLNKHQQNNAYDSKVATKIVTSIIKFINTYDYIFK